LEKKLNSRIEDEDEDDGGRRMSDPAGLDQGNARAALSLAIVPIIVLVLDCGEADEVFTSTSRTTLSPRQVSEKKSGVDDSRRKTTPCLPRLLVSSSRKHRAAQVAFGRCGISLGHCQEERVDNAQLHNSRWAKHGRCSWPASNNDRSPKLRAELTGCPARKGVYVLNASHLAEGPRAFFGW
jgi:hypothetical protein